MSKLLYAVIWNYIGIFFIEITILRVIFFLATAQGIGIFIVNKLSQIKKWSKDGGKPQR